MLSVRSTSRLVKQSGIGFWNSRMMVSSIMRIPRPYDDRKELLVAGKLSKSFPAYQRPDDLVSIRHLLEKYHSLDDFLDTQGQHSIVKVGGRILAFREASSKLIFGDLYQDGERIQIILNKSTFSSPDAYKETVDSLQRGDLVEITGRIDRTKSGELSVRASSLRIVAPCTRNFPALHAPEMTEEHCSRWRHLDLLSRPDKIQLFKIRSKIIRTLRGLLEERDFTEVETPMLCSKAGGAQALPFETNLKALSLPLFLRIAPELYLKRLIIGGLDRVFEIGKIFRNEGLDATHNPEFTSCELYQSFASAREMISLAESVVKSIMENCLGSKSINYQGIELDFASAFKKIDIVPFLQSVCAIKFELDNPQQLFSQCLLILQQHRVSFDPENRSLSYLFDKLIGHFIEPICIQPTFLINHPTFMSPLASSHCSNPYLSDRFELFVAGMELMNGYSELNDPNEQRSRFTQQLAERRAGNGESHVSDDDYIEAMECGLPPTGGLGIGIDRLVMLLTNKRHIRDVLLFPLVKPLLDN